VTAVVATSGLECRSITAGHGGIAFLHDVSLDVSRGRILALVGPNGAGKTTLLLTLAGLLPSLGGEVLVNGTPLRKANPTAAGKAGLVLVPDDRALFPAMTVAENLEVARRRNGPAARDMLELFPSLEPRWKLAAGNLSGGEQQMLAVARALMQEPSVLLIDELSMGLAPTVVEAVLPAVRRIADEQRAAVVLVEQHVGLALKVADDAVVLVHGKVVLRDNAADLAGDLPRLEAAYLGSLQHTHDGGDQ
jgi:branched-chain amino acid transport system ATP-binding protein